MYSKADEERMGNGGEDGERMECGRERMGCGPIKNYGFFFASSQRKLCNGEKNFRIKNVQKGVVWRYICILFDSDDFCFRGSMYVCVCIYFNSSYLRNESTDFHRVKLIPFVSRENEVTLMDLRFY